MEKLLFIFIHYGCLTGISMVMYFLGLVTHDGEVLIASGTFAIAAVLAKQERREE
jgi:hypothetical protein